MTSPPDSAAHRDAVLRQCAHLCADYPRFAPALHPQDESRTLTNDELRQHIPRAIADCQQRFNLEQPKHAAQVWWFSACNTFVGPAVTAAVEYAAILDMHLDDGQLFLRDDEDYWLGFMPGRVHRLEDTTDESTCELLAEQAAAFARSITPIVEQLAEQASMRPKPLFAIAYDALIQAAINAGNDSFDPAEGIRVAHALGRGFGSVTGIDNLIVEVVDGQWEDADVAGALAGKMCEGHHVARRVSCCMIFHSASSGKCANCPRQTPQDRHAAVASIVDSDF
ncbi:(2Fe-2S)-binding protein [Corynebacterium argentoratense]|uniref:(2Fe-2S)-binding protein n=1 Tax=Corynebacterium argentoratense TaxID=42817 RepID=UPI003C6EF547